jgi:hypothetical protein
VAPLLAAPAAITLKLWLKPWYLFTDMRSTEAGIFSSIPPFISWAILGIFERLSPLASPENFRIIAVNRRVYSGSTPYTQEELITLNEGSESEVLGFLSNQGIYLALFIDALIQQLDLPKKSVAVAGWSLGSLFLSLVVNSIVELDKTSRDRLADHVCSFIYWGLFYIKNFVYGLSYHLHRHSFDDRGRTGPAGSLQPADGPRDTAPYAAHRVR